MFLIIAVSVCLQTLFIQGYSAQCIGAYNGFATEGFPGNLAWENRRACSGGNAYAWEAAAPFGVAAPCSGSAFAAGFPYAATSWATTPFAEWGAGYSPAALAASNGEGLAITSASPIAPNGVSMSSENVYEGPLSVSGAVPFLGAVALEGVLPTGGAGSVAYGCGNGNVAILNEDLLSGYDISALGYGAGISGPAYGCNAFSSPVAIEAGIAGPAFRYNNINNPRFGGCGCGGAF